MANWKKSGMFLSIAGFLFTAGCKSHPFGPYVSPRVQGQVVDAENGSPLENVKVSRNLAAYNAIGGQPKGGELLMLRPPAETGPDGRFTLSSERVLSIIRGSGWNEVKLVFEKAGYFKVQTNIPTTLATNSAAGEPLLLVNPVPLQRVAK